MTYLAQCPGNMNSIEEVYGIVEAAPVTSYVGKTGLLAESSCLTSYDL